MFDRVFNTPLLLTVNLDDTDCIVLDISEELKIPGTSRV